MTSEEILILFVEDNAMLRKLGTRFLEMGGWEVITAQDGEEALELFEAEENVSLLATDLNLPGIDGIDLAQKIVEKSPGFPVLLLTGHDPDEIRGERSLPKEFGFIQKPYSLETLTDAVTSLLNKEEA